MKWFTTILMLALLLGTAWASDRGIVFHEVQIVDETGAPVTDVCSINIYNPDTTTNAIIYKDRGLQNAITQSIRTDSTNTTFTQSLGTFYWWGPDGYDYTFTNGTNIATNAGHRTRHSSEGRLYFPSYLTNISSADYEDGESVSYGSDDDFIVNAGTTANRLTFTPIANDSAMWIGTTGLVSDLLLWGDTAGYDLMWDASDNRLEFDDNAILGIGNDPDWYIVHNGTTTTATGALTHASAATFSTDVTLTGNAYNVEWDNSSDTLHLLDDAELGLGGATAADGDVVFKHDGTDFTLTTIRASEPWDIGGTTNGFDITYFWATAGTIFTDHDGDFVDFSDDMEMRFGTGAGTLNGDFKISSNSSNVLQIEQVALDTGTITIGADNRDIPIIWYAETSGAEITTTGDTRVYDGVDVTHNDDDIVNFGDSAEVAMTYDEDGNDLLQVTGPVEFQTTLCRFQSNPVVCKNDGTACAGAASETDWMAVDGTNFEYFLVTAGTQTIKTPFIDAYGLNIRLDQTDNEGLEMGEGITARSKSAFTIGTDAFYLKVKLYAEDVNQLDICAIGFRLAAAYNQDMYAHNTYAGINIDNGVVNGIFEMNAADANETDCGETWANGASHTLEVRIDAAKAVTRYLDGTAVSTPLATTWTDTDTVVPFLHLLGDASAASDVCIKRWECGLQ